MSNVINLVTPIEAERRLMKIRHDKLLAQIDAECAEVERLADRALRTAGLLVTDELLEYK